MKKTRICTLLSIGYPIVQAPMAWIATAELVSAVSEAGGIGTLGPNAGMESQSEANDLDASIRRFREQVRKVKSMTSKPFAANIPVGWGKQREITDKLVDIAIEEKLPVAVVSMGSSRAYTKKLKSAGIKVLHAVGSVEHAVKAEGDGVDAVICEGYEAGGHLGGEELTTMVMVPQIVDAVNIPVIAGGGIVDGRGVAAAFALGAEAVYIGTRFMCSTECRVHPYVKQAIVDATDTSTVAFARKTGLSRCLKNRYTQQHIELESRGASFEEIRDFERTCPSLSGWRRVPGGLIAGNMEDGSIGMGAAAGIIKEVLSAKEIIRKIVMEYESAVKKVIE